MSSFKGASEASDLVPRHLVRGVGAVGDSKQDKQLLSDL